MLRLIVTSATYRQSSVASAELLERIRKIACWHAARIFVCHQGNDSRPGTGGFRFAGA